MQIGGWVRAAISAMLGLVVLVLVLTGCTTKESDSGASASGTGTKTSVIATKTPTSSSAAQEGPGAQLAPDGSQPESSYDHSTTANVPGTDQCGGAVDCGKPSADGYVKCTDQINYAGDPRSNAEINSTGERDGKCPEPIRATGTTSVAVLPPTATSDGTTS